MSTYSDEEAYSESGSGSESEQPLSSGVQSSSEDMPKKKGKGKGKKAKSKGKAAAADDEDAVVPPNGEIHRAPELGWKPGQRIEAPGVLTDGPDDGGSKKSKKKNKSEKSKKGKDAANDPDDSRYYGGLEYLIDGKENIKTTHDALMQAVSQFGDRPFLGARTRRFDCTDEGNDNNPYVFKTYAEVGEEVRTFARALDRMGAAANIGIYSKNRSEWVIASQACAGTSRAVVPLYDTLGPEVVKHCMTLTDMDTVVCEEHLVGMILAEAPETSLKHLIVMGSPSKGDKKAVKKMENADGNKITIYSWEDALEAAGADSDWDYTPPSWDDTVTICFTSGTTNLPKGVVLTHGNLIADIAGASRCGFALLPEDVHISYLPLAHIFERQVQIGLMVFGGSIGFFRGNPKMLIDDIKELRPTLFATVPRLLNKIYDSINSKSRAACCCKAWMFSKGVAAKLDGLDNGTNEHGFYDGIVFGKVKQALGGRVRIVVTGSAPIAADVMRFARIAFGAIVLEGYGQTEGSAACTLTRPEDFTTGHVGAPLPCAEIALGDVRSMGYYADEAEFERLHQEWEDGGKNGGEPKLGGEICMRGPITMREYYKQPDKTAETIDEDGWLHTGDIGRWIASGPNPDKIQLKIVDRKKNIFKLSQGEYVAPEKVEGLLKACVLIESMWVYGDSLKSSLVAVVQQDPIEAKNWAKAHGKTWNDDVGMAEDADFNAAILAYINERGDETDAKGQKLLLNYERPRAVFVERVDNIWEPGTDVMTSTFKLKRPQLQEKYQAEIDAMYAAIEGGGDGGSKKKSKKSKK